MPSSPHRLFASIVVAGMSLAGCSSAHAPDGGRDDAGRDAALDAGRDAGRLADASLADAGRDAGAEGDAGDPCATRECEPCSDDPICDVCTPCII